MRGDVRHMWTGQQPCCVGSDCHLVVHLWSELVLKHYVNPFRCWFHTSVFHPIILLTRTFGPLRLLGATLMCIAQTMLAIPLNYFIWQVHWCVSPKLFWYASHWWQATSWHVVLWEWCKTKGQDKNRHKWHQWHRDVEGGDVVKAIPFTIRDREISEGRVMLAHQGLLSSSWGDQLECW